MNGRIEQDQEQAVNTVAPESMAMCSEGPKRNPWLPVKLEGHKAHNGELLEIYVMDRPGAGGAHHRYLVTAPSDGGVSIGEIKFQSGPIQENGVNGLTQEVLLAIVEHRLQCFQRGHYACAENARALQFVQLALEELKRRTFNRITRGVEGRSAV